MRATTRLPLFLSLVLAGLAAWAGIDARDPLVWALETLAAVALAAMVWWTARRHPLSASSFWACFAFLAVHLVGSHYTYSLVPGPWQWGGRNQFDRLVHLLAGLLLAPVVREALAARMPLPGRWSRLVPLAFVGAAAGLFEVAEMALALAAPQRAGGQYLGAQGDGFDAVWDILAAWVGALASLGAQWARDAWRSAAANARTA